MTRLAIIHTSPATIEPLKNLAREMMPGIDVINFLDDSILPQLRDNGGNVEEVAGRLVQYATFAEQAGADVILSACSSVGEVAARMRERVSVPVVRIDEAMAETAVRCGRVIGVAATLATTLNPTLRLIQNKAASLDRAVELKSLLVNEAYQKLIAGDAAGHDVLLAEALLKFTRETDVIVLAQASMARVLLTLPDDVQDRFLTSPRLGIEQVKTALRG